MVEGLRPTRGPRREAAIHPTEFPSTNVLDAMKTVGVGSVIAGLSVTNGGPFAGRAVPVQCVHEPFAHVRHEDYRFLEIATGVGPGDVLVIDAAGIEAAVFGGVAISLLSSSGAAGLVIDGCIRAPDCEAGTLPVVAGARTLLSGFGHVRRELVDRVVIKGREIRRGDHVLAGPDGVLVVPEQQIDEVLAEAQRVHDADAHLRESTTREELACRWAEVVDARRRS